MTTVLEWIGRTLVALLALWAFFALVRGAISDGVRDGIRAARRDELEEQ